MYAQDVASRLKSMGYRVHQDDAGWRCQCPSHGGEDCNLEVKDGDEAVILTCWSHHCPFSQIVASLGLAVEDMWHAPRDCPVETVYPYRNAAGEVLYEVHRTADKKFSMWLPGADRPGIGSVPRLLFGIPALLSTPPGSVIGIVEGEKAAVAGTRAGLTCTTNPNGAGKWREEYTEWLKESLADRRFLVLPDNDEEGRRHAQQVFDSLRAAGLSVRLVALEGLPPKGDLVEWLLSGHKTNSLIEGDAAEPDPHDPFSRGTRRASDLPEPEDPPINWFGLYRSAVTLLIGETGAGKSSLLYNVAVHAARNEPLWDIPFGLGRPLTVLYIDPENSGNWDEGRGGLCAVKLARINGGKPERLIFHDGAGVNLADPVHMDSLRRYLLKEKVDVAIIDPVANLFNTQDENDNAEAARQMKALIRLSRATGVTIIVCHHTGKESGGIYGRGASARLAAADVGLVFRTKGDTEDVDDDYNGTAVERDDVCRLQIVKNRLEGRGSLYLRMAGEDRFDRIGFAEWQKAAATPQQSKAERCREEIMLLLADGLWHLRSAILSAMQAEKFGRTVIDQELRRFVEEGFVEERRAARNAAEYRWFVPEEQEQLRF